MSPQPLSQAKGVYPILATPFNEDDSLDLDSLKRLTEFLLEVGSSGLTILGVLGEANKLTPAESKLIIRTVIERSGKKPVVVGASFAGVRHLKEFALEAMNAGASGVMLSPPAGLRTDDAVKRYFASLFKDMAGVPVVLQDYPQNSGVHLSAPVIRDLFEDWTDLQVLKHEDVPGLRKITRLRDDEKAGRKRITILVGNSAMHLPQELRRGADGANTGVAFPEMLISVCDAFSQGNAERGEDIYDNFLPLLRHEQQLGVGLALRKEILCRRGLIRTARVRAPGPSLDKTDYQELSVLLGRLKRKLSATGDRLANAIPGD